MTIDTRTVHGRRRLTLHAFDHLLQEAEALTKVEVNTLGNWSLGQILEHVAVWINFTVDGFPIRAPLLLRVIARPLRKRVIRMRIPAGFTWKGRGADKVYPSGEVSPSDGLQRLRRAIERFKSAAVLLPSPLLGELSREEWEQFHMRHAEHHLSFVVPP